MRLPRLLTTSATAAVLAAASVVAAPAASAQQPGQPGERAYVFENAFFYASCLYNPDPDIDAAGGLTYARGGRTIALVAQPTATGSGPAGDPVGPPTLYRVALDPCGPPVALGPADAGSTPSFSPDGRQLAVQRGGRIAVVDTATGATVRTLATGIDPSWDPAGKGIAYRASDGIRVVPPGGGTSRLWKQGTAKAPDYSPDGRRIAYLEGGKIRWASASSSTSDTRTTPITAVDFTWSPTGTQFLFTAPDRQIIVANTSGRITERLIGGSYQGDVAWQPLP